MVEMDKMAFASALEFYNKEFNETESRDKWYPPDNTYTVMVSKINRGVKDDNGIPFMWYDVQVQLLAEDHPDVNGKEFQLAFLNNNAFWVMKKICNQISQNTEKRDIKAYDAEMDGYIGTCMNVRVHKETSKKGTPYVACDITEIIESETVVPPQEG